MSRAEALEVWMNDAIVPLRTARSAILKTLIPAFAGIDEVLASLNKTSESLDPANMSFVNIRRFLHKLRKAEEGSQ